MFSLSPTLNRRPPSCQIRPTMSAESRKSKVQSLPDLDSAAFIVGRPGSDHLRPRIGRRL
jgi:hypothetical protein